MTRSLYDIGEDLLALESILLESGGDITEEEQERILDQWLFDVQGEEADKVDRYVAWHQELNGRAKVRKAEAERLLALERADSNLAERLKERLLEHMKRTHTAKYTTRRFSIAIAGNGGKKPLIITAPDEVPLIYCDVEPSNAKLRDALESGEQLSYAMLGERGTHLRIR